MNLRILLFYVICLLGPAIGLAQNFNYTANMLNVPTLSRTGEFEVALGRSLGELYKATELQAAYGIRKHWLLSADYFDAGWRQVRNRTRTGTDARFGEVGIGWRESVGKGTASLVAGFGMGSWYNNYNVGTDLRDSRIALHRWYLQPGITLKNKAFFSSFGIRLSRVHFRHGTIAYNMPEYLLRRLQFIQENSPWLVPEVGMHAGIVLKMVTFSMGFSAIFPNTRAVGFNRSNFGAMLRVNLK